MTLAQNVGRYIVTASGMPTPHVRPPPHAPSAVAPPVIDLHPVIERTSAWHTLWPLLLTAALTLAATLFIQFYVVPLVETRKRREDRWERDLLTLGELLTFDYPDARSAMARAASFVQVMLDIEVDPNSDEWEDYRGRLSKQRRKVYDTNDVYVRMNARVEWLTAQIESIAPRHQTLAAFSAARRHQVGAWAALTQAGVEAAFKAEGHAGDIDALQAKERDATKAVVAEVGSLLSRQPPTPSRMRSVGRRQGH